MSINRYSVGRRESQFLQAKRDALQSMIIGKEQPGEGSDPHSLLWVGDQVTYPVQRLFPFKRAAGGEFLQGIGTSRVTDGVDDVSLINGKRPIVIALLDSLLAS